MAPPAPMDCEYEVGEETPTVPGSSVPQLDDSAYVGDVEDDGGGDDIMINHPPDDVDGDSMEEDDDDDDILNGLCDRVPKVDEVLKEVRGLRTIESFFANSTYYKGSPDVRIRPHESSHNVERQGHRCLQFWCSLNRLLDALLGGGSGKQSKNKEKEGADKELQYSIGNRTRGSALLG